MSAWPWFAMWFLVAWGCAGAAALLLFSQPGLALAGYGHVWLPSFVHLLTLGVILTGHYGAQALRWRPAEPDGPERGGRGGVLLTLTIPAIWVFHAGGVLALIWGLGPGWAEGQRGWAYLGGHYLVPTAIVLSAGAEVLRHRRERRAAPDGREAGRERNGWQRNRIARHLPGLGLLVAMSLGVMLVLDHGSGRYGFYGLPQIALHALAAAFLFVLPAQALAEAAEDALARRRAAEPGIAGISVSGPVLVAGLGLFAIALDEGAFGAGFAGGLPLGLALLGAVALWTGLPSPEARRRDPARVLRRLPWALFGLILLLGALRAARGQGVAEGLPLATMAGAWFLLGVAAPDWLLRMTEWSASQAPAASLLTTGRIHAVLLAGALAVLAGQGAGWAPALQAGALLWLAGWLGLGWRALGTLIPIR